MTNGVNPAALDSAELAQVTACFNQVDRDRSGHLTLNELQQALANSNGTRFNNETVSMLLHMFDTDRRGTIELHEFVGLHQYISQWHRCFQGFDTDRSGAMSPKELGIALHTFGYRLNKQIVDMLACKFGQRVGHGPIEVPFDNFIQVCVTIQTLTDNFIKRGGNPSNLQSRVNINYEEFFNLSQARQI